MASVKKTGGGSFDKTDKLIYFIASNPKTLLELSGVCHRHLLTPANELLSPTGFEAFEELLTKKGQKVFLDSGVFSLASEHAKNTGCTHDEALKVPINQMSGFKALYKTYVETIQRYEKQLWGYVEIDLGGTEQKRKTRAGLEKLGLRPIPVYHPLSDGWDYFDELASQYDRICVGNIVQASRYIRLRIQATIWERKKKYPKLWVHLLGMTPNEWAYAYPTESMDSSSWLCGIRWSPSWKEKSCLKSFSSFSEKYIYILGDLISRGRSVSIAGVQAQLHQDNWRHYKQRREEAL